VRRKPQCLSNIVDLNGWPVQSGLRGFFVFLTGTLLELHAGLTGAINGWSSARQSGLVVQITGEN
jgi:hypothetical protein